MTPNYLILVNEDNRLPDNFEDTVELVNYVNEFDKELIIEKKTLDAFLRLKEEVYRNDGIEIELSSVYRDIDAQEEIYERYLKEFGEEYAKK